MTRSVKTKREYKSLGRTPQERTQEAYKGYLINKGFDDYFRVTKDGHLITTQASSDAAKAAIDLIVWD